MVIQRWQSVWLLIAAALTGLFCFMPMALVPMVPAEAQDVAAEAAELTPLLPRHMLGFMVMNLTVALLLFLAIFMYRNLRRQKTVTMVSMLLLVVSMATEAMVLFSWDTSAGKVEWLGSIALLVGALVFAAMAWRGIRHDERLLRSADRLR